MNPRYVLVLKLLLALLVIIVIAVLFPAVFDFLEMAARDLRYLWWIVLLVLLAFWLIWGLGRKKR